MIPGRYLLVLLVALSSSACGPPVAIVSRALTPPEPELTSPSPRADFAFEVTLSDQAPVDDDVRGDLLIVACVEEGPAGSVCLNDRSSEINALELPDVRMAVARTDNAVLPVASVDMEGVELYEGAGNRSIIKRWVKDEDDRYRRFIARFDRGDYFEQAAGVHKPLVHVVWQVTATVWFEGLDPEAQLPEDWLTLRMVE